MALGDILISPILAAVRRFLGPLNQLWEKIVEAFTHLTKLGSAVTQLVQTIKDEIEAWRTFKENPRWRSRVISVPIAFEKTKELVLGIPASWHAIVDLFTKLKEKINTAGDPEAEAKDFAADLEGGEGISGFLRRVPRLVKGLERLFGFLAIAVDALETISGAIDDLQTIVDETARIRSEIEQLDSIFLSQKNPRKTEKLVDGGSIKIRVGNLHK